MAVPSTSSGSSLLAPKCGRTWDNGISLSDTAAVRAEDIAYALGSLEVRQYDPKGNLRRAGQ